MTVLRSMHRRQPRANQARAEATARVLLEDFGRAGSHEQGYFPTDFGCPDCRGVLYVTELGDHGFLSFRCRVGHVFSADAIVELKEDRLDEALFTALELLEEIVQLETVLAARGGKPGVREVSVAPRVGRARKHARTLRGLMRDEGPAPPARRRKKVSVG
jgi:two-component system chemotaxis response regulator CheB